MDVMYSLGSGQSGLNCDDVSTNACPAPQGACAAWESPSCKSTATLIVRG